MNVDVYVDVYAYRRFSHSKKPLKQTPRNRLKSMRRPTFSDPPPQKPVNLILKTTQPLNANSITYSFNTYITGL